MQHSRHRIELRTLPARFWRWRMRGAAFHFAHAVGTPEEADLLLVSDLMNVADLKAVWGAKCPPIVLYVHENQLSYPTPAGEQKDFQFAFTDIASALAADAMVFNSHYHRDAYFAALPAVLRRMPEYEPAWIPEALAAKASVLYPGCRLPDPPVEGEAGAGPPLVIWNHRWEFDKQPAAFFAALSKVQRAGVAFEVALLGENAQYVPQEFIAAREWLGGRVVQYGYLPSRNAYLELLGRGSVVVSAAIQENFGISVVEAVAAGCHPLLPCRLAYPEVIPDVYHAACLYDDDEALAEMLSALLSSPPVTAPSGLAAAMQRYSWDRLAASYDALFEEWGRARR